MATGVSEPFAFFQATGISGYRADDPHQNVRRSSGPEAFLNTLYLNIFNMNPADDCYVVGERTNAGVPCNANPQFQQHGYSTTMRDSRFDAQDPDRQKRFDFWIGRELVNSPQIANERVLLFDGLARVLARARAGNGTSLMFSGDFSGEYSLTRDGKWEGSGLKKWHPSVTKPQKYQALATWQPLVAWAGWWVAFSRKAGNIRYIPESELKGFFMRGEFPKDWEPTSWTKWGFQEDFETMVALEGRGLGETWISNIKSMMVLPDGTPFEEKLYQTAITTLLAELGIIWDSVHHTWPPAAHSQESNSSAVLV